MKDKKEQPWQKSERLACKILGMEHIGGPKNPDCKGKNIVVEVKDYRRNFNTHDLSVIRKKSWAQNKNLIVPVINGCTPQVKKHAEGIPEVELLCDFGQEIKKDLQVKKKPLNLESNILIDELNYRSKKKLKELTKFEKVGIERLSI